MKRQGSVNGGTPHSLIICIDKLSTLEYNQPVVAAPFATFTEHDISYSRYSLPIGVMFQHTGFMVYCST